MCSSRLLSNQNRIENQFNNTNTHTQTNNFLIFFSCIPLAWCLSWFFLAAFICCFGSGLLRLHCKSNFSWFRWLVLAAALRALGQIFVDFKCGARCRLFLRGMDWIGLLSLKYKIVQIKSVMWWQKLTAKETKNYRVAQRTQLQCHLCCSMRTANTQCVFYSNWTIRYGKVHCPMTNGFLLLHLRAKCQHTWRSQS